MERPVISLKDSVWEHLKCFDDSVSVIKDKSLRPAYFTINKDGVTIELKHSSIPKVILKEEISGEDVLMGYPPMLPNSKRLDLSYAIEGDIKPAPLYWVE